MTSIEEPKTYPASGPLAVLARLALIGAVAAIVYATIGGGEVLRLLYSSNLEHFAAFYIAALAAALAFPRGGLTRLASVMVVFAAGMEASRLFRGGGEVMLERWCADVGGVMAAYAPILAERFRRMFPAK